MIDQNSDRKSDLTALLAEQLTGYTPEQVIEIREVMMGNIGAMVDAHLENRSLLRPPKDTAALFNGILNGTIAEIQNFTADGAGRRLFTKAIQGEDKVYYQPYVRNKDGKEEEWNITLKNLNNGLWAEVPSEEERVGFGIALDALLNGQVDFIRCEDWPDHRQCLRRTLVICEDGNYYAIRNTANGALFCPSSSVMASKNWIMFKLSKVAE